MSATTSGANISIEIESNISKHHWLTPETETLVCCVIVVSIIIMNHTLSLEPGVLCGALCRLLLQSRRERPNHQKRHEECWLGKRDLASVLMQQKALLQNSKWIRT